MRFLILYLFSFCQVANANPEDDTFQIRFNNVSTERVFFSLAALNEDGERDTDIDIYVGEAQAGSIVSVNAGADVTWKIEISSNSDDYLKSTFIDNGINSIITLREVITGNSEIPKNPTPIHGYLNIIDGVTLIAKGAASLICTQTIRKTSHILRPPTFKKATQGIRFVISHSQEWFKTGLSVKTEEFSKVRKGVVRVGTTRL
ncbi:MAG: hypothetical protein AB8C84_13440 [Oligoflexales bacterium]